MSIQSHVAELERRHQALDRELSDLIAHPSSSDREIAELKRTKLQLKDQIEKLRKGQRKLH